MATEGAPVVIRADLHEHYWQPGPAYVIDYYHDDNGNVDWTKTLSVTVVCPCGAVEWREVKP